LELLDLVGITRAVVVGGSLGGRVALEMAMARPSAVGALVLVSPALPGHDWCREVREFGDAEDAALDAGEVDTAVELNMAMWFDGPRRSSADVDPTRRASVALMQRRAFELQRAGGAEGVEELLVPDLAERVAGMTVPMVIVVGEHDVSDFHAIGAQLAAKVSNSRLNVLPGAAHVPYYERPEVFDPVLVAALNDLG
jgi:pimeloyl-ACP methyl ester carboxylesterase